MLDQDQTGKDSVKAKSAIILILHYVLPIAIMAIIIILLHFGHVTFKVNVCFNLKQIEMLKVQSFAIYAAIKLQNLHTHTKCWIIPKTLIGRSLTSLWLRCYHAACDLNACIGAKNRRRTPQLPMQAMTEPPAVYKTICSRWMRLVCRNAFSR